MTAAELEKLLAEVTPGEWSVKHVHDEYGWYGSSVLAGDDERVWLENEPDPDQWDATLIAMAPALARRVIAAERMAEAAEEVQRLWAIKLGGRDVSWRTTLEHAMEESAEALAAYEAAK